MIQTETAIAKLKEIDSSRKYEICKYDWPSFVPKTSKI